MAAWRSFIGIPYDNRVTNAALGPGTVTTVELADGSVTTPKLADNAVSTLKIADGAVSPIKLTPFAPSPAGVYGNAANIPQITVNSTGQITNATSVAALGGPPSGAAGNELAGTYPNPTISNRNGTPLLGDIDVYGNRWFSHNTANVRTYNGETTITNDGSGFQLCGQLQTNGNALVVIQIHGQGITAGSYSGLWYGHAYLSGLSLWSIAELGIHEDKRDAMTDGAFNFLNPSPLNSIIFQVKNGNGNINTPVRWTWTATITESSV